MVNINLSGEGESTDGYRVFINGEEFTEHIKSVRLSMSAGEPNTVEVTFAKVDIDVVGDFLEEKKPYTIGRLWREVLKFFKGT